MYVSDQFIDGKLQLCVGSHTVDIAYLYHPMWKNKLLKQQITVFWFK